MADDEDETFWYVSQVHYENNRLISYSEMGMVTADPPSALMRHLAAEERHMRIKHGPPYGNPWARRGKMFATWRLTERKPHRQARISCLGRSPDRVLVFVGKDRKDIVPLALPPGELVRMHRSADLDRQPPGEEPSWPANT